MKTIAKILSFIFLLSYYSADADDYVSEKYFLTKLKSTFCDHKFLPFPCYDNRFPAGELTSSFFSMIGEGYSLEISSPEENFSSESNGLFTTGPVTADLYKREDLVSLGNYYKKGPEFVKTGVLTLVVNGQKVFSSSLEFQINGQDSRSAPQKALRLKLSLPLPLSSYAPKNGEQKLTLYPLYGSLGGTKVLHELINEIFSSKEIWFEKWPVIPVVINNEFWGVYFLARPDLSIQNDYFGFSDGIEGTELKDKKYRSFKFNEEALLKFLAFQTVVSNEDLIRNFRTFILKNELHFTYTDLDETFKPTVNESSILKALESDEVLAVVSRNSEKFNHYKIYWSQILKENPPLKRYEHFTQKNFPYLLFNDLRWGKPYRSKENTKLKKQLSKFEQFKL